MYTYMHACAYMCLCVCVLCVRVRVCGLCQKFQIVFRVPNEAAPAASSIPPRHGHHSVAAPHPAVLRGSEAPRTCAWRRVRAAISSALLPLDPRNAVRLTFPGYRRVEWTRSTKDFCSASVSVSGRYMAVVCIAVHPALRVATRARLVSAYARARARCAGRARAVSWARLAPAQGLAIGRAVVVVEAGLRAVGAADGVAAQRLLERVRHACAQEPRARTHTHRARTHPASPTILNRCLYRRWARGPCAAARARRGRRPAARQSRQRRD